MSATHQINLADIILGPPKRPVVPARVASLAESIFRIGVLQPVILDEGKNLLAGRHRYLACQKLGMTQIPYTTPEKVKSSYSARLAVLSENLYREELTALQRSEWVEEYEKLTDEMDNFDTAPGAPRTTKQKAEAIGMSERTLQECKQIASKLAPEVKQALEGTEVADSQKQLLQLARMTPEQQAEAVERFRSGAVKDLRAAARDIRRETLHSAPLPDGVFNLVTADPPWQYDNDGARGSAENHYPTLSLDQMLELPIGERLADNVVMFLWVTTSHQAEALMLLDHWGLEFKSEIIWVKPHIGTGYYTRGKHEKLWICTRGDLMTPSKLPESVQHWPVAEHSRKPAEAYQLMLEMYPHLTHRLELFGRSPREGFTVHGNEADKFAEQAKPLPELAHV